MPTRREFLQAGASLIAFGGTVPAFLERTVAAATRKGGRRRFNDDERVLVVLQLAGGNDGLNTIVPTTNDVYYAARPRIAVPRDQALPLDGDFGLHGQAVGLKALYDAGLLGVVHGVGYPNPNRSHFKSMDIWHTASPEGKQHSGWLGRYFDNECRGSDPCDPTTAIALMNESPLALRGERFLPLAFEKTGDLSWVAATRPRQTGRVVTKMNQPQPGDHRAEESTLAYLRRVALNARLSAEQIQAATGRRRDPTRGRPLTRNLLTIADLLQSGMKTRIYYVSQGGYDTHANQPNRHGRLLAELGEALQAFLERLKAQGDDQRVLVMSFSEFGRRVEQNGSNGTDHGAAGPMLLAGAPVRPGLHGRMPDLADLNRGDLRHTTDFRSVYATVIRKWLGQDADGILGGAFPPLPLLDHR